MNISHEFPPIYDDIVKVFPTFGNAKPIFSWGDTIYQPFSKEPLSPELIAHEAVHGLRQASDFANKGRPPEERPQDYETAIRAWWRRYLDDPAFRLEEEIPAHRAELGVLLENAKSRDERRFYYTYIAERLCAPLYRFPKTLINVSKARVILKGKPEKSDGKVS